MIKQARLLVVIPTKVAWNNFVISGALNLSTKKYRLIFLAPKEVFPTDILEKNHILKMDYSRFHLLLFQTLMYLSMSRFKQRSSTFNIKSEELFFSRLFVLVRFFMRVLALPVIYTWVAWIGKMILRQDRALIDQMSAIQPDGVLFVSGFSDLLTHYLIGASRQLKVPSFMLMANWDNVASKGVLLQRPDKLGVWGLQTKEQAMRIHQMVPDDIFVLGSPQFEQYRLVSSVNTKAFRSEFGFSTKKPLMLFVGTARYRDEVEILSIIDDAINQGRIEDSEVIYRPHPWRERNLDKESFFAKKFRNVKLDPEIKMHYYNQMHDVEYDVKSYVQDWDYAKKLLCSVDVVLGSLTTMGIEAMLCGKPVLLPVFSDKNHRFSLDTIIHYEHHRCWAGFRDVIINRELRDFEDCCNNLIKTAKDKFVSDRLRQDAMYVVDLDHRHFSVRLEKELDGYLASQAA